MRWFVWFVLLAGIFTSDSTKPLASDSNPNSLTTTGTVTAVDDGTTLRLEDGTVLRLAGLLPPQPPLGYAGLWRTAEQARQVLTQLSLGQPIVFTVTGTDRWGRRLGTAALSDGRQIGRSLVVAGWAQVSGLEAISNRDDYLRLEAEARREGRGLWSDAYYTIRNAETLPEEMEEMSLGRFLIVEGRVADAAVVRGRAYLNFGVDWRQDFTATLSPDARRRFRAAGLDPRDYTDRRLRVRGWLESFNGPMIEVLSPDQIEVLEDP